MADDLLPLIVYRMDEDESSTSSEQDETEAEAMPVDSIDTDRKSEAGKVKKPLQIRYDSSLPGSHSYLGNDLEELRGRTIHEADQLIDLPVISIPGVVLVPGQTIPLSLFQPHIVEMVRTVIAKDKTFGLVTPRWLQIEEFSEKYMTTITSQYCHWKDRMLLRGFLYPNSAHTLARFGTTAEIFSIKDDLDELSGISTLRIKAKGRQRFEVLERGSQITGVLMAKVRILPERNLCTSLEGATPFSHAKFCGCMTEEEPFVNTAVDRHGQVLTSVKMSKKRKIDRFSSAYLTWWPPWVYKMYDERLLMRRIQEELHSWNETLKTQNMPSDPVEFSYWVAQNLPLDDNFRLYLLSLHSAVQRLRCEIHAIEKCTILCCRDCGIDVTNKNDVFSMAAEGPLGAYVNPSGHVHDTLTVHKASGLQLIGYPSSEHSWFPGYAWTVAQCSQCTRHMGWRFTATNKKLCPQRFWGLCRASLIPDLKNGEAWTPFI